LTKADIDEVIDKKDRSGAIGYMTAGKDAMRNKLTEIEYKHDPKDYELILIGGPVWAWTVTPAIRTYLDKNVDSLKMKKVAFFATQGSSGAEGKFQVMENILGIKPFNTMIINGKDFKNDEYEKKVEDFILPIKVYG